jgi:hypothetical protein
VQVNGMRKGAVSAMQLEGDHVIVDLSLDRTCSSLAIPAWPFATSA